MKNLLWGIIILSFVTACTSDLTQPTETILPTENLYAVPPPTGALARLGRGVVNEIALSPDGEVLAVASSTGLYLYSTDTFQEIWSDLVTTGLDYVAWSPDGGNLAGGTPHDTVIIWDAASGERSITIVSETTTGSNLTNIHDVAWSPDGDKLAFGDWKGNLTIWDASTGENIYVFDGNYSFIEQVDWSLDGKKIAAGTWNGDVLIWDAYTGLQDHIFEGYLDYVDVLSWSPTGSFLAAGCDSGKLIILDSETNDLIHKFEVSTKNLNSLAWSFDGNHLAVGGTDGYLAVMDVDTGEQRQVPEGRTLGVNSVAWFPTARSGDTQDSILFSAEFDGAIRKWDLNTGEEILTLEGHTPYVYKLAWSPDNRRLAAGTWSGLDIWAADNSPVNSMGTLLYKLGDDPKPIAALAWSPDGDRLAASSWEENVVVIWDPEAGERLDTLEGHLENMTDIAWSPDGRLIASGDEGGTIILWNVDTGEQIQVLEGHDEALVALAWSPDGSLLASSSSDGTLQVWDVSKGQSTQIISSKDSPFFCIDWSPDGAHIAVGSFYDTITLWDVETGEEGIVFEDQDSSILSLDWSPDGTRLASGGLTLNQVFVWDIATGETLYTLEAHSGSVMDVAWSPDGSMLASASLDGTVILWDASLLEIPPAPTQTPGPSPTPTLEPQSVGPFRPVAPAEVDFLGDAWGTDLYTSPGGNIYLYSDEAIAILSGSTWEPYLSDLPGYLVGFDQIDRVWVASEDGGQISAWDGLSWKSYGVNEGWAPFTTQYLWDRPVQRSVHTDSSGQVWVGTFEGLRVFDGVGWTVYALEDMDMPPSEYEESNYNFVFTSVKDGSQLWVGACDTSPLGPSKRGGLSWFDGEEWHGAGTGIPQGCAGSIQEDAAGRIWAGVNGDVWLFDPTSGVWKSFTPPAPLPPLEPQWYGRVTDITLDPDGNPWITFLLCGGAGCEGIHLLHHLKEEAWIQITESSFQIEGLQQLVMDGTGTVWLFWNGTIYTLSGNLPEPVASLVARKVVLDSHGQLWLIAWYEGQSWLWVLETE